MHYTYPSVHSHTTPKKPIVIEASFFSNGITNVWEESQVTCPGLHSNNLKKKNTHHLLYFEAFQLTKKVDREIIPIFQRAEVRLDAI